MSPADLSLVERLLLERIGLDPKSVGEGLIARAVQTRMIALGLTIRSEYEAALLGRPDELQALVEEVVVPESWFFRDDRPFEVLTRVAQQGWVADPSRAPLTALSLPCAGGEEPYSIAMTLIHAGLSSERFRVDGVDVSTRSLSRAIAGVYSRNAFRGAPASIRSAHFREQGGAFSIEPAIRAAVRFQAGNLLDPGLLADRSPFDVVFCRNLLIYFDDESKARAFANLARLVADGGLLFLGHADRMEPLSGSAFEAIGDKGSFAYRKRSEGAKPVAPPVVAKSYRPLPSSPSPVEVRGAKFRGSRAAAGPKPDLVALPSKPRDETPNRTIPASEPPSVLLDRASTLADLGQLEEARALVDRASQTGGPTARGHFLLGLIAQGSGHRDETEAHFLKAIYLDPSHDEALLALAILARRKGDLAAESAYHKRAARVRSRKVVP